MLRHACAFLCCLAASCTARPEFLKPIDRADLPVKVTRVRGNVYLVEDFNYWKTNSLFYAGPEGIVFVGATWSPKSASQVLWKAATFSTADFTAVTVMSHSLHQTGGLAQFRRDAVPIHMRRETIRLARDRWNDMHTEMSSFGSWRAFPITDGDSYFEDRAEFLDGRIVVTALPAAHTADNSAAYFPREKILYAGSLVADPIYFDPVPDKEKYGRAYKVLREMRPDIVISGHGEAVQTPQILDRF